MTISDDWIEWSVGQLAAVWDHDILEVLYKDNTKGTGQAKTILYGQGNEAIRAYRVVVPAKQPKANSALDVQEGGDHYKKLGNYQPWEVLAKWLTPEELKGFAKGTVVAYLAREEQKGGRLDIKKALHTLQIYLELSEPQQ